MFGLEATIATFVGNEVVPGVSGGERKRVSLAEVVSNLHIKILRTMLTSEQAFNPRKDNALGQQHARP